ncbi:MAG: M48 family metallopeptidase [candidate division KSB1 bacterium]|nr:M48 family metallopeptidase [candidate division KSB1 bacterium]
MNLYGWIILAALLIETAVQAIAKLLNLKSMTSPPPEELSDVYDGEAYRKSQAYERASARLGLTAAATDLVILLAFWFLQGFDRLQQLVESFGLSVIPSGLIYIGILAAAKSLLDLPFDAYAVFAIEERFGFNRMTVKTFLLDRLKGAFLGLIIGAPLLAAVLFFFDSLGGSAWLYAWMLVTFVSILLTFLAPSLILPLFNKFTPLPSGELYDSISRYAQSVNYPLQGVYVTDGSRRSTKGNAYFIGFGKKKRIALFDTLIEKQSPDEITAVLAHEIGHYKKKHVWINLLIHFVHSGLLFFLLSLFLRHKPLYEAFFMQSTPIYAGLVFFGMLYSPVESLLGIFLNALSRRQELAADRYVAQTLPQGSLLLISSLKKLAADHLENLTPHPFYVWLNYSHPPLLQRIQALKQAALTGESSSR